MNCVMCNKVCKNTHCSKQCEFDKKHLDRYKDVYTNFVNNIDEVSYLIGLILGDGHIRKREKRTSDITISFNYNEKYLINQCKSVLKILSISFYECNQKLALAICFKLPQKLLKQYGIDFVSPKYDAQPSPNTAIRNNINFAIGLINSDGCHSKNGMNSHRYVFSNTVWSIFDSFIDCLTMNCVKYITYQSVKKPDLRTGKIYKTAFVASIGKRKEIDKLLKLSKFEVKH